MCQKSHTSIQNPQLIPIRSIFQLHSKNQSLTSLLLLCGWISYTMDNVMKPRSSNPFNQFSLGYNVYTNGHHHGTRKHTVPMCRWLFLLLRSRLLKLLLLLRGVRRWLPHAYSNQANLIISKAILYEIKCI